MNGNILRIVMLGLIVTVSGCTNLVERIEQQERQQSEACQRNYDEIKSMISSKSGKRVEIQDPKGFLQGKPPEGEYTIAVEDYLRHRNINKACDLKPEDVTVRYYLLHNNRFRRPYSFQFVVDKGQWETLQGGTLPHASTTRPLLEDAPQLSMQIEKMVVEWVYPERTVSDGKIAVTIHEVSHSTIPKVTYTIANTDKQYITLKGISFSLGNVNMDYMYPNSMSLAPQREFRKLDLTSSNRLQEAPIDIDSLDELNQPYKVSVSVLYSVNGVDKTLLKEFSVPLADVIDF